MWLWAAPVAVLVLATLVAVFGLRRLAGEVQATQAALEQSWQLIQTVGTDASGLAATFGGLAGLGSARNLRNRLALFALRRVMRRLRTR